MHIVEIAIFMLADFVAFQSQVLVINDSDESLTDANAKRLTTTRRNNSGSMSAMDNGRGSLEISWGFGLEKGRRTAMEDAIAIVPMFLSPVGWKDDGSVEEDSQLVRYFGLFDLMGTEVFRDSKATVHVPHHVDSPLLNSGHLFIILT